MTLLRPGALALEDDRFDDVASEFTESRSSFAYDIAVVGLGYVGLPTALAYFAAGRRVLGVDVSASRLQTIRDGGADLLDSDRARLASASVSDRMLLTADPAMLSEAAAVVVCVPTPVDEHLVPDLTMLRGACCTVLDNVRAGQLLMLTSTTYVGCTEELLVAPLEDAGYEVGRDVYVSFSAERIDPGNRNVAQEAVPRVAGGATGACLDRAEALLRGYAAEVHRVTGLRAAEMTKLLENTFRAVNIALVNEFADICAELDVSVTEVIGAASTKPYGFMAFQPGPGVGGHCIPCDPHYLLWQLQQLRRQAPVITAAMNDIAARPHRVFERIRELLADRGRGVRNARVLVAGVAYKPDVADLRESPALEILAELEQHGAVVGYVDHLVPAVTLRSGTRLADVSDAAAFGADVVVVHTRHSGTDLGWAAEAPTVLDCTYRAEDLGARAVL